MTLEKYKPLIDHVHHLVRSSAPRMLSKKLANDRTLDGRVKEAIQWAVVKNDTEISVVLTNGATQGEIPNLIQEALNVLAEKHKAGIKSPKFMVTSA